ncbi:MAG: flagellar biosynthesis protein FlhB [Lachnobacterium sp.]|nr:flagellar biosynthesis protein FlhB [Lachnobacterium sp.]MDD6632261.1 flagellar biosynthesis protein FlhB [Lachnobacterium sp.]
MKDYIDEQDKGKYLLEYNLQWFAKDGEGGEKTEPATAKKLKDARDDGKVTKSKELTAAFDLIVLFLVLKIFISFVGERLVGIFDYVYSRMPDFLKINSTSVSPVAASHYMADILLQMLLTMLPFLLFGFVITFLVSVVQVGWKVTGKPLKPDLNKFNPINGFKRIISKDSLFELLKSIIKIAVIFWVAYSRVKNHKEELFILYEIPLNQAIALIGSVIIDTGLYISIVYLVIGFADFAYQKHKFNEDMKMTKQEVKDEFKNTEGDPQIKGRQRRKMQETSQRRMMHDVPKADVVITNPTHLAVAVKYDADVNAAPVVLAKGEEYVAQKIKEVARENNIEIVENKPLARMLYHNVDIGAEIPPELYQAVAEVLATIYKARN